MEKRLIAFAFFASLLLSLAFASAGLFSNAFYKSKITGNIVEMGCTDSDTGIIYSVRGETAITTETNYNGIIYEGQILTVFGKTVSIEYMNAEVVKLNIQGELTSSLSERESEELYDGNRVVINDINYIGYENSSSSVNFSINLRKSATDYCYLATPGSVGSVATCSGSECMMTENYCSSTGIQTKYYQCNGTCTNGACTPASLPDSCTDSDGGIKYNIKGEVTWDINGGRKIFLDYCENEAILNESYCLENVPKTLTRDCGMEGKICKDGACVNVTTTPECITQMDCPMLDALPPSYRECNGTKLCQVSGGYLCKESKCVLVRSYYNCETCPNGCSNGACKLTETYYPAPFVVNGVADVAIIYGTQTSTSSLELIQAGNIQEDLNERVNGTLGEALVKDSDTYLVSTKNWIVVGTPCTNSVIWKSLGLSDCTSVATKLGISPGKAAFKSIQGSNGKLTFLVVGYTTEDLVLAVRYFLTKPVSTTKSYVITVTNSNETIYVGYNCTDSDGGKNYYLKGELRDLFNNKSFFDTCIMEINGSLRASPYGSNLSEGYCTENSYKFETYVCPNGCREGACIQQQTNSTNNTNPPIPPTKREICINAGGIWKVFSNGCADSCELVRNMRNVACTQVITEGCECGPDKCWTGTRCELNNQSTGITTCNSGCLLNQKCYTFGYRKSGVYCAETNAFIPQLGNEAVCENNFECKSNLCIDSQCMNQGLMKKFMSWLKGSFRKG
ncbi:MAG: hypothetical protein ACP5NZ_02120 [Nanobdellota archaeon]